MTSVEFESRVVAWVRQQPEVEALIQIGSRVQSGGVVDAWSDWDYQLVLSDTKRFLHRDWLKEIAPVWCAHLERTERKVVKLSAVFAGGFEADFVLLPAWQMKLACWGLNHPQWQKWFPSMLRRGVYNLQLIGVPGYRVVLGGPEWEKRLAGLRGDWSPRIMSAEDFDFHVTSFWRHAVWVFKKTMRGEFRAAQRWHAREVREHLYALLEEEARVSGLKPRPEARQAERWLTPERLAQTSVQLTPQRAALAQALLAEVALFREATASVATLRGFKLGDYSALENWLRSELGKLSS
ncbi:aminoglycoside 6-adenylyltransferase [Oleiharenicola lentus]|uniref:aminoglycoside 6-adenylyltransferase n=1 Tax=Oleiharenicola lentus TaxID=2508720 RepID=UPI003F67CED3